MVRDTTGSSWVNLDFRRVHPECGYQIHNKPGEHRLDLVLYPFHPTGVWVDGTTERRARE